MTLLSWGILTYHWDEFRQGAGGGGRRVEQACLLINQDNNIAMIRLLNITVQHNISPVDVRFISEVC